MALVVLQTTNNISHSTGGKMLGMASEASEQT